AGGPISLPPGSFAHSPPGTLGPPPSASPFTGRYGLSAGPCANGTTRVARNATMPNNNSDPTRLVFDMTHLSGIRDSAAMWLSKSHRNDSANASNAQPAL